MPEASKSGETSAKRTPFHKKDSHRQFKLQDSHFYSALEHTKWLQHISCCLKVVVEAAQEIQLGTTVVLQESDGRDTSALISSLVQLILDSHTRSIVGFQSLIQKEWVALGHPFCKRLGLLKSNNSQQSPVFLLFLDCVWQLQNQFPTSFEFTETYLTTLWDSVHISVFDTFLFDCERDRADAIRSPSEKLQLRSVWNWDFQFSDNDIELFINPLFKFCQLQNLSLGHESGTQASDSVILPEYTLPYLGLWMQCYFRWLPLLSIRSGGQPQVYIVHKQLMLDIQSLLSDIQDHAKKKLGHSAFSAVNNSNNTSNSNNNSNNGNSNSNNNNNSNNNRNGSGNHNRNNNNNHNSTSSTSNPTAISSKSDLSYKSNCIYSIASGCSKDTSTQKCYDFNKLLTVEHNSRSYACKDVPTLFNKKDALDNFFPFTISGKNFISGVLTNSENLSEFYTSSVYNLTD